VAGIVKGSEFVTVEAVLAVGEGVQEDYGQRQRAQD
jgi:hypothetical protein